MRIALLSYEYPPDTGFGGIGTYTFFQARALARLGHDVHVFAGSTAPTRSVQRDGNVTVTRLHKVGSVHRLAPRVWKLGLPWFASRLQNASDMLTALRRELRNGDFDVVEMPECGGEGALINHWLPVPTVVRFHSPAELIMPTYDTKAMDRALTATVERIGIHGARALSSCSHWLAEEIRRKLATTHPITVIPNGIDLALFDEDEVIDVHGRFDLPRDRITIFYANRLEPRKGIHVVTQIIDPILDHHPDACFVLAGDDPQDVVKKQLLPRLRARGREHALRHLGRITPQEVRACLKQCDVFILPSIWENAPYSLLEAMSAGRAIVASDCGGVPEMLRHEIDGLIARAGDAESFRRALDRLLKSEATRRRFGISARQRVEARFTDEVVARQSLDFYARALEQRPGTGRLVVGASRTPVDELGPNDWYQAWWFRGEPAGPRPVLRRDATGRPELAKLPLDAVAFVFQVLDHARWRSVGSSAPAESEFLRDLAEVWASTAEVERCGRPRGADAQLSLPLLSHPTFGDELSAHALIDELWRIHRLPEFLRWARRELSAPDFVERASRRLSLRRLAIEVARVAPDEQSYATLRGVYRTVAHHATVVAADRAFIDEDPRGPQFAAAVAQLGLHAPLRRKGAFRNRRQASKAAAVRDDVTVLIPSFRHERYVEAALRSVLEQTALPARILVVDDRSPDRTAELARTVGDPRIEVVVNEENLGLGASLSGALDRVTTPFIAILNSDDLFAPQRLERCLAAIEHDPHAAVCATALEMIDGAGRLIGTSEASAVDVGPRTWGWMQWYERIRAGLDPERWTDFGTLLRHNHLVSSSNLVVRTDWLREHRPLFEHLRYCLDWALFLRASSRGALRFVDEPGLGYRLHDSNTVWFEGGTQADYVHEANRVAFDAVRSWVDDRRQEVRDEAALADEVAALLEQDVAAHGENDGLALALAALCGSAGVAEAARAGGSATASAAFAALRRQALRRELAEIDLPGWRLAELARNEPFDRAARHAAEAALAQARLRTHAEAAGESPADRQHREDVAALCRRFDEERDRLAHEVAQLRSDSEQLRSTARSAADRTAQLEGELAAAREHLADAVAARARAELRIEQQLALAARTTLGHRRALDELHRRQEWRLGRLVLDRLRLRRPIGTAIGGYRWIRNTTDRLRARAARRGSVVVLAADGAFPTGRDAYLGSTAKLLATIADPVIVTSHGRTHGDDLTAPATIPVREVRTSKQIAAADRRWLERRTAEGARRLLEVYGEHPKLDRLLAFVRFVAAADARYAYGAGLGFAAAQAHSAALALGIPFALELDADDVAVAQRDRPRAIADAACVVVACDAAAAAVAGTGHARKGAIAVRPPVVFAPERVDDPRPGRFVIVGPLRHPRSATPLAEAVAAVRRDGADIAIDVLGAGIATASNLQGIEWLRSRAHACGAAGAFTFHATAEPAEVIAAIGRSTALIDVGGAGGSRRALPRSVVIAFASGRPVVGWADALDAPVADLQNARLAATRTSTALAAALTELLSPELAAELGREARRSYDAALDPGTAGAEFLRRIAEALRAR